MDRMDIRQRYFMELGKVLHYELKAKKYFGNDTEKYEKYMNKMLEHKKKAAELYYLMKENPAFLESLHQESVFIDSRYFRDGENE